MAKKSSRTASSTAANRLPLYVGIGLGLMIIVLIGFMIVDYSNKKDLYENQITLDELNKKVESGEDFYVYFYQPDCKYCNIVSPYLIPLAEEMKVPLYPVNLARHFEGWQKYNVQGTPTLSHFKDGKEVMEDRIVGENPEDAYRELFSKR